MAVPLSPVASTHFHNLSPSPITPKSRPSPIYRAPSSNKSPKSTRNTVHWDESNLHPSISKTAVPAARNKSPSVNGSGSLKARKPSQEFDCDLGDRKFRGHQRRTPLDPETFVAPDTPDTPVESDESSPTNKGYYLHGLIKAARDLKPDENVFEKHRKKQFDWVLTLPASLGPNGDRSLDFAASDAPAEGARHYFGCNLLGWTKSTGKENQPPGNPGDRYLLLATPLDLETDCNNTTIVEFKHREQSRIVQQGTQSPRMAANNVSPVESVTPRGARSAMWSTAATADASEDSDNTLTMDPRREMKAPLSTIEDSLEELDHFEDEVDAISTATRLTHLSDPEDKRPDVAAEEHMISPKTATKSSLSATKSSSKTTGATRAKTNEPSRSSSVHKPSSLAEPDQDDEKMPSKAAPTRKVARPASLAPPKPLQKASKPPTVPTFELPGERVARELKEKKAARLSMQLDAQKLAEVSSPPQRIRSVRSSKPPTVPNFELPGEIHSRMKRERLAAKLKAEEEEAARRRQFKARPPPSSVSTSATVRSTFTSRQRETQTVPSEQQQSKFSSNNTSPTSGAAKRQSVTMSPSMARTVSNASASSVSTAPRGRTSSVGSSRLSSTRATSSSNGSVVSGGKRNSIPSEEAQQQQRARGRSIYTRDNSLGQDKEREKRERQQAIALARQKYAEQSRMLAASRRLKQQSSSTSSANERGA